MRRRIVPILLALGMLYGTCAWAQNDTGTSDTTAPVQPGPKPAYTYPDATPSLDFLNGAVENSSITLGIGSGVSYLSNGYSNSNLSSQGRWQFQVMPRIAIQQFRPKLRWNLGYSGGYQTYTQPSSVASGNYNLFSQDANAGLLWQFSPHWQLSANDSFIYSANPFDSYLTHVGTPTLNNPNPVTYSPTTQYKVNNGVVTLADQLTKVDTLVFTGTTDLRRTSNYNLLTSVPFYNLVSYGGRAAYSHKLSARLTLGVGYNYNSITFGTGQQKSGIQTIQFTGEYLLRPNMSISGWIGPQYTGTKTVVGIPVFGQIIYITSHGSMWSTAGGVTFGWHSLRNSVTAAYARGVSDGGGILATSQTDSISGSYRRALSAKMDALFDGRFTHLVSTASPNRTYDYGSFTASLDYKLTKSLSATGRYAYVRYNRSASFLVGYPNYSDNIVGGTINYTWTHPLGR